jgi:hypothetical protein
MFHLEVQRLKDFLQLYHESKEKFNLLLQISKDRKWNSLLMYRLTVKVFFLYINKLLDHLV